MSSTQLAVSPFRWTFYIDKDGIIKEIDKTVKADQAGPDIAAKLKSLGFAGE